MELNIYRDKEISFTSTNRLAQSLLMFLLLALSSLYYQIYSLKNPPLQFYFSELKLQRHNDTFFIFLSVGQIAAVEL